MSLRSDVATIIYGFQLTLTSPITGLVPGGNLLARSGQQHPGCRGVRLVVDGGQTNNGPGNHYSMAGVPTPRDTPPARYRKQGLGLVHRRADVRPADAVASRLRLRRNVSLETPARQRSPVLTTGTKTPSRPAFPGIQPANS